VAFVVFCGLLGAIFFLPEVKSKNYVRVVEEEESEAASNPSTESKTRDDCDATSSDASHSLSGVEVNLAPRENAQHNLSPVWKQPQAVLAAFQYTVLGTNWMFFVLFYYVLFVL
jgi:hypothetical protein